MLRRAVAATSHRAAWETPFRQPCPTTLTAAAAPRNKRGPWKEGMRQMNHRSLPGQPALARLPPAVMGGNSRLTACTRNHARRSVSCGEFGCPVMWARPPYATSAGSCIAAGESVEIQANFTD